MDADGRRQLHEALARLAAGDRSAFHPVFERAWPVVRDFCRSALRDQSNAEDAAQQALLRLFERAAEFDARRDALPFILGVAWNECRTLRRRTERRREESIERTTERAATEPDPEERVMKQDLERAGRDVLLSLPPGDIEAILADLGERGRPLVASATFRKRLERARRRLREAWRAKHGAL